MLYHLQTLFSTGGINSLFILALTLFQLWMFIHALIHKEYLWAVIIFVGWGLAALIYYFQVYRPSGGMDLSFPALEFPGASTRRKIKELEAKIHHLDKAHHYLELGDIYYDQNRMEKAEEAYRAAYERDPNDEDIQAHLGACLLHLNKKNEALPLLETVCQKNPRHDYGSSLMMLAEAQKDFGQIDAAMESWRQVLQHYDYPQARVQYAELLIKKGRQDEAREHLEEVVMGAPHAVKFQKRRDYAWVSKAKSLLKSLR